MSQPNIGDPMTDDEFNEQLADLYTMADTVIEILAWLKGADLVCVIDGLLMHEAADQWRAEKDEAAV